MCMAGEEGNWKEERKMRLGSEKKEIDFVEREKEKCNGEKMRKLILRERKIMRIIRKEN